VLTLASKSAKIGTMKHQLKTGVSFGLTSGIITTLGLMVGLHSGTQSRIAVVGGILTIAIADASAMPWEYIFPKNRKINTATRKSGNQLFILSSPNSLSLLVL